MKMVYTQNRIFTKLECFYILPHTLIVKLLLRSFPFCWIFRFGYPLKTFYLSCCVCALICLTCRHICALLINIKGYLHCKTSTSQNVSSEAQVKNFFYFVEKLCSFRKIFRFLHFQPSNDLPNL